MDVEALLTLTNGDLIVGGLFTSAGGVSAKNIARWNGASWSAMAAGNNGWVHSLATLPNGDLVAGGSFVTYSVGGGAATSGLLVHRARPGLLQSGVVPVASLPGATLIGMRAGQRAPLLCEDGSVKSLLVLDTVPPA